MSSNLLETYIVEKLMNRITICALIVANIIFQVLSNFELYWVTFITLHILGSWTPLSCFLFARSCVAQLRRCRNCIWVGLYFFPAVKNLHVTCSGDNGQHGPLFKASKPYVFSSNVPMMLVFRNLETIGKKLFMGLNVFFAYFERFLQEQSCDASFY